MDTKKPAVISDNNITCIKQKDVTTKEQNEDEHFEENEQIVPLMNLENGKLFSYNCNFCEKKFHQKSNLIKHLIDHTGENIFKCGFSEFKKENEDENYCIFEVTEELSEESVPVIKNEIIIPVINKKSTNERLTNEKEEIYEEIVANNTDGISYKCNICEKSYSTIRYLKTHILNHEGNNFKCDLCEKLFTAQHSLKRHLLNHDEKKYKCDFCEKIFHQKQNLIHLVVHTGDKKFQCGFCDKLFSYESTLKSHLVLHTGDGKFKCDYCDKSFYLQRGFQQHLTVHNVGKQFKCNACERSFVLKTDLERHSVVHTGKKNYECDTCKKAFSQKRNLQKHLVTQHGEKKYKCGICEKLFYWKRNLKQHLISHADKKVKKKKRVSIVTVFVKNQD